MSTAKDPSPAEPDQGNRREEFSIIRRREHFSTKLPYTNHCHCDAALPKKQSLPGFRMPRLFSWPSDDSLVKHMTRK